MADEPDNTAQQAEDVLNELKQAVASAAQSTSSAGKDELEERRQKALIAIHKIERIMADLRKSQPTKDMPPANTDTEQQIANIKASLGV